MVASGFLLALLLSPFASAWAFDGPWFLQPVSSNRKLNGDELLRIGEIHDVQNHFPEALTYYEQALDSFRARKQRRGEAITLTKIALIFERQGHREAAAARLRFHCSPSSLSNQPMRTRSWPSAESLRGWEIAMKPVDCLSRRSNGSANHAIARERVGQRYSSGSWRSATVEPIKERSASSKFSRMHVVVMTRAKPSQPSWP